MLKSFTLIALLIGSFPVVAKAESVNEVQIPVIGLPTNGQLGIPVLDASELEAKIKIALQAETGIENLQDFHVDWSPSSVRCLKVRSEMSPESQMGVCVVGVSAFQVEAKAAIVKRSHGYAISLIYANVD